MSTQVPQGDRTRQREMPSVETVLPDVWSVPVPIPDNPLHYVISYALEAAGGLILVDVGWNDPRSYDALVAGLGTIGASITDVKGMIVTHVHPDHYGLAGRVKQDSDAWIALHGDDASQIAVRYEEIDRLLYENELWLRRAGAPDGDLDALRDASVDLQRYVMVATPDRILEDGDRLTVGGRTLDVLHTPGHTKGHVCLYDRDARLMFTGDHVLPRISPNVGFHPLSDVDPLRDFLTSLGRVGALEVDLALPGHEWRFTDLTGRVDELTAHHGARLEEVRRLVAGGRPTSWEVASALTWSRPWNTLPPFTKRAALSEAMAHLIYLETSGELRRIEDPAERWELRDTTMEGQPS